MNTIFAIVTGFEQTGSIALLDVEMAGLHLTAMLVGTASKTPEWMPGMHVRVQFAEIDVALAKNMAGLVSLRNRLPAAVTAIEHGRILTKVTLNAAGNTLASLITTRAATALSLQVGDQVEMLIKSSALQVVPHRALQGESG